jgi:hypothetical protein
VEHAAVSTPPLNQQHMVYVTVHTQNYLKGQEAAKNSNGRTGKQHDSRCLGKPSQQQVSTLHQAVVALSA